MVPLNGFRVGESIRSLIHTLLKLICCHIAQDSRARRKPGSTAQDHRARSNKLFHRKHSKHQSHLSGRPKKTGLNVCDIRDPTTPRAIGFGTHFNGSMSIRFVPIDSLAAYLRCKAADLRRASVDFATNPSLKEKVSQEEIQRERERDEEELAELIERQERAEWEAREVGRAGFWDEWSSDSDGHWSPRSP